MNMEKKEMKMYAASRDAQGQSVDETVESTNRKKRVNLDHAERGGFIPFADVLKKLG